jgi:FkbM family methyltransferase
MSQSTPTPHNVVDQRGLGKRIKSLLPGRLFRALTVMFNAVAAAIPFGIKYPVGTWLRKGKFPYSVIRDGDIVVQLGAPRDLLHAGRSRALHFTRLVGRGKVVVLEPDPQNVEHFCAYARKHGLEASCTVFPVGGWRGRDELVYYFNPHHPASNVLEHVVRYTPEEIAQAGYEKVTIPVDSLDNVLAGAGIRLPRLVSITTNGSEMPVLEGMRRVLEEGLPYISVAPPRPELIPFVENLGYVYTARDDRGYFFTRQGFSESG